jgi:DNA invertase Pin-like site-specific DNA recombinase
MRMLDDVRTGRIDLILFIKLDRWFRNVAEYYEVQRILDEHKVHWIATEEDYDTTTANGRLHLNIKLSIAQDESDRTSERIKFVFESKVKRGEVISGKVPLGYKIENKCMQIDASTAPIVQASFRSTSPSALFVHYGNTLWRTMGSCTPTIPFGTSAERALYRPGARIKMILPSAH